MREDDVIVTPSEELKALLAMMAAKQTVKERPQVILSDDAEAYLRLETYLDIMRVGDPLRQILLHRQSAAALQRAVAKEDILVKMQMIDRGRTEPEYAVVEQGVPTAEDIATPPPMGEGCHNGSPQEASEAAI
ncbi:MAG: hypothetical protein AB7S83_05820 [Candidatus Methanomethylophilaceae archaeon]